ncbi:5,10-methylenetetrahydrofolate reductase [Roseibacterium elongatum DSM 19469]|uniref:5,10-methylenetetrahydrofolate reductase n=1 Tax=Roseicyclus elongatus DSM 19469 TaxID=1294273 RepID=W8RVT4_9RHOB|nr:methylenetetrahydrofolate reductase [Roseibacterium elongatum]AHM05324.1 5,10-methylenetetrahydrofolate reductase [Roseibacterium elongatum DSM 19469]
MALLSFRSPTARAHPVTRASGSLEALLQGYSIEVMPRTADKVADFRALLPAGTRIYIAHIDGTPIEDMVHTARRLARDGFEVMPHFPARSIPDAQTLSDWIARYQDEANVTEGLILAGGIPETRGRFHCSMQLLETGLFDKAGFKRLHVAGHPEGNRDIDPKGGDRAVMDALRWKQAFSERTDAKMALATQFAFDAGPVIAWAERLRAEGIDLPIHLGIAGPAKLQTLIKFAIACGVGPSLGVLQRRARDVTKLVKPMEPTEILRALAAHKAAHPDSLIERIHFFPLGGIRTNAEWAIANGGPSAQPANTHPESTA